MEKRGQGAMEYLMTYGWAILVVIIVGIVLWQSGVFGTGSGGVSGFDKARVRDFSFTTTGVTVKFENAAGQTMKSVTVGVNDNGSTANFGTMTLSPTGNWAPGKEYQATNGTAMTTPCTQTGAGYALNFLVNYSSEAGITHTETGTIRGKCE